jgi:hypothetical protein
MTVEFWVVMPLVIPAIVNVRRAPCAQRAGQLARPQRRDHLVRLPPPSTACTAPDVAS